MATISLGGVSIQTDHSETPLPGYGYGPVNGQIGITFVPASAQALNLAYGIAQTVTFGTVTQNDGKDSGGTSYTHAPQAYSDKATDEAGKTTYSMANNQPIYTGLSTSAVLDGWYSQREGTGGLVGSVQTDNTIASPNDYLDVPLSFSASEGAANATLSFLAALPRNSGSAPASATGTVMLYHGYVADPDVDFLLKLGTRTAVLANGDKLTVAFNPVSLRNNPETAAITASVVLSQGPTFSIAPAAASKSEGNAGATPFTFTVTRTGDASTAATLTYAIAGSGTARAAASDFVGGALPTGTVSFAAGDLAKTITIQVNGDTTIEPDETFAVTLAAPAGASVGTSSATGTILDDDGPATYSIAALSANKAEGNSGPTPLTFTVSRSGDPTTPAMLTYAVAGMGGNPANASDFTGGTLPTGTVSFATGELSKTITMQVNGDTTAEPDETFAVTLSGPAGTQIGTASAAGTIVNDDGSLPDPATVGVYRFFDKNYGTHFFTASQSERDTIVATRPDLAPEGIGLAAVDPASGDPNSAPVYRFFDKVYGTHFFTASAAETAGVIATRSDLTFEGVGFYEHTTQQAGDVAVYRFFDTSYGTHFYTSSASERASILAARADLKEEGIGFYAPASA